MSEQKNAQKKKDGKQEEVPAEPQKQEVKKDDVKKVKKDLDDLIEKIDDVLEENAEEFVKNYVQKGGE